MTHEQQLLLQDEKTEKPSPPTLGGVMCDEGGVCECDPD